MSRPSDGPSRRLRGLDCRAQSALGSTSGKWETTLGSTNGERETTLGSTNGGEILDTTSWGQVMLDA